MRVLGGFDGESEVNELNNPKEHGRDLKHCCSQIFAKLRMETRLGNTLVLCLGGLCSQGTWLCLVRMDSCFLPVFLPGDVVSKIFTS